MCGKPLSSSYAVKKLRQVRRNCTFTCTSGEAGKKLANSSGLTSFLRYMTLEQLFQNLCKGVHAILILQMAN